MPRSEVRQQAATTGQGRCRQARNRCNGRDGLQERSRGSGATQRHRHRSVINCAGIIGVSGQKAGKVDYGSWAHVLDVNTMGPMRVIESFTDQIARSERRLVVTITSGMGSIGDNTSGGSIAYRSSKAAVNMAMRSAAIDLAPQGITCVVVNPGWVKTDMGGPNATLTPEDSVTALRRLIEKLGTDQSGKFFHYDGSEHPW
jgi:NAD(P)-dependent dehydrogenase (short-subunit alcohol dehydrogenase family)